MRKNDWLKMAAVLAALCLAPLASYAQDQGSQTGDPVADAARKARAEKQKKDAQKPKKVYTDDDVKPATPEKPALQNATATTPTTGGAESTATAGTKGTKENAEEKEDPNSEKAWRKRFSEQHAKIAKAEKELDILQRELQKSQLQYYPDPTKAMTEQNSRTEINDKTAKIEAKKKELEQLKQQLDDMETELRKSGGDAGWAQ
ncbi:MAG: hypothetical protein DMG40_10485 [Acidobacteria bacterium]|nr:MAG: hypothetical protein DMG40_10485 [Acidobacteriota bacterium]